MNQELEERECLGSECNTRSGHVLWCPMHPNYPHDGPDPYYQKLLEKEILEREGGHEV